MALTDPNSEEMKRVLKEALAETLHEQRGLLHEIFAEVLEDFALAEATREGQQTDRVNRDEVFDFLEDRVQRRRSGGASCGISRRSGTSHCDVV